MSSSTYKKERAVVGFLIAGNALLMVGKILAGAAGRSSALVADGLHSGADVASSVAVLFSIKLSVRPPDEEHPYGHGKVEAMAGTFTAFLLAVVAVEIAYSGLRSIFLGSYATPSLLTAVVAVISIATNEVMFRYGNWFGNKVGSQAMIANSWDNRSDALSSLAAVVGIVGARFGFRFLDPLAAIAVSVMIMRVVYHLLRDSVQELMDRTVTEVVDEVVRLAERVQGVEHAYARVRRIGRKFMVDMKVEVNPGISVADGHDISLTVKNMILAENAGVSDVMIHIHPHDE